MVLITKNTKSLLYCCMLICTGILILNSCSYRRQNLIYVSNQRLCKSKNLIKQGDSIYIKAYNKLVKEADKALLREPNPVTNKTQFPPSGNKHDYMSIAPYRWPNQNTPDGLPWILKDGQINPMYYGHDFDNNRLLAMFNDVDVLWMAYYFTGESKYAEKASQVIKVWFFNEETRVNPNVNYGQGIPGEVDGRRAGIIEWMSISNVISAIQVLENDDFLLNNERAEIRQWFKEYYHWLKTNSMGIENDNGLQNHSTCYDYQMVGLARFLGYNNEAKQRMEAAKTKRIAVQIKPDGTQPREMGRTRSVHYASENMLVMCKVAELGFPLGVDLWNFSTSEGRSMKKALAFLRRYAEGKLLWPYNEIGGIQKITNKEMKPLFWVATSIFQEKIIDENVNIKSFLNYKQVLLYPLCY